MILILTNPKKFSASTIDGFLLFANCVFPGLFPFLILTKMLTDLNCVKKFSHTFKKPMEKLFKVNGITSYVFLMAAMCGYPMGAKLIADIFDSNIYSEEEAKRAITFCSVSGPIFTIGAVGANMLGSLTAGLIIYISHIASSLICGLIFCNINKSKTIFKQVSSDNIKVNYDSLISNSVSSAISTILTVGALVTIFFVITDCLILTNLLTPIISLISRVLSFFKINPEYSQGLVCGIIEITRGAKLISSVAPLNLISITLCSGIISFGGLSIGAQCLTLASRCKIKAGYYFFVKFIHFILSIILCFSLCLIFGF
ncbi:MAG: hypothetical protein J5689_00725 [Clostridia bacterium]|nr:hypothetical protein [Clostridia bacterium]